jgi:glycosyltransferase involved in cell wall biosynthesis
MNKIIIYNDYNILTIGGVMIKIAEVCPSYYPYIGGVETHVKEISERLVKLGHEVEVITTRVSGEQDTSVMNGVKITRFPTYAPDNAYYFSPKITKYMKSQTYDIIHIHNYNALPAFFAMLAKGNRRIIFTPHYHPSGHTPIRTILRIPYSFVGKHILDNSDWIISVSEYEKKLIEDTFDIHNKIVKIPNGIITEEFAQFKGATKDKNKDHKILLYVGRIEKYKGIQNVLRVMPNIPEIQFKIVGKGNYTEYIKNMAKSLKIEDRISWYEGITRDKLLEMYAEADIFIMLSSHEAFGISVAEALYAGTPCIVAKGSALEEFIDDVTCVGLDLPVDDSKLITSIRSLYNHEATYEGKILDWNDVVDQLITIFSATMLLPNIN